MTHRDTYSPGEAGWLIGFMGRRRGGGLVVAFLGAVAGLGAPGCRTAEAQVQTQQPATPDLTIGIALFPDDDAVIQILQRHVKQHRESIEQFDKGGRPDLSDKEKGSTFTLSGDEGKYLTRVLRLSEGDKVTLCTDGGLEYECSIKEIGGKTATVSIDSICRVERESPLSITLCQALPKGKKMDLILQKGTELGVRRFVPFMHTPPVLISRTSTNNSCSTDGKGY